MAAPRKRLAYCGVLAMVIVAGLASRSDLAVYLPEFVATYAGDTLWALMVFLGLGFWFPRADTFLLAGIALAFSFAIEFSQFYQADWINGIRDTKIGALVLGAGFKGSDLICYSVGVALGVAGELLAGVRKTHPRDAVSAS